MIYARISGTGSYLPENVMSNHDLEKIVDTSDQWIRERTGIEQRHIAADGETTVDLAEKASRMAIESAMDRESLVIKIHPDDRTELEDYGQELIQLFHDIKNVKFESHASVPQGNCVVETNFGTVEAGLDHLDEHIERILHLAPPPSPPTVQPNEPEEPEPSA